MLFLFDQLSRHRDIANHHQWYRAGRALESLIAIWAAAGWNMSENEVAASSDAYNTYLACTDSLPELHQPKRHLAIHLLWDLAWHGNPRFFANWTDESLIDP